MDQNLKSAIVHFLANEFKLEPSSITNRGLNFKTDLNLDSDQLVVLLQRLQDALNFTLPEDNIISIESLDDLFRIIDPEIEIE